MITTLKQNENFKVSDKVSDKAINQMNDKQREFYNVLVKVSENNNEINTRIMVEQTGWGESTVRRYLKQLCDISVISSRGKNKSKNILSHKNDRKNIRGFVSFINDKTLVILYT